MNAEHIKEWAKKHWVLIAAVIAAFYLLSRYFGGSSSGSSTAANVGAYNAQIAASNAAQTASNNQAALQQATLAAQANAAANQAQVQQTQAVGTAVGQIGQAIAQVITSQSALPAAAIQAVSINNQQALAGAAQTAVAGAQAVPGILTGGAQQIAASYSPVSAFGGALVGLSQSISSLGTNAANAVGQTASGGASAAAASAGAAANANAQSSAGITNLVGTAAMAAILL